jgi:PIN domain nuclease of toxin-antitoxin system
MSEVVLDASAILALLNTKSIGLSFGDRACLALGIILNQPVLTTDRLWVSINVGVEVRLLR